MKKISLLVALSFSPPLFAATDLLQVYREALTQDFPSREVGANCRPRKAGARPGAIHAVD